MPRAISSKKATNAVGCLYAFLAIFAIIGLCLFVFQFALPVFNTWRASRWTPVNCSILSSTVITNKGSDSSSYSPDVGYSYTVNGQEYTGNRYSFFKLDFQNTYQPQALIQPYPSGTTATCYVDPSNPANAVLNRNFQAKAWVNLGISLAFVLIPGAIIFFIAKANRQAADGVSQGQSSWQPKAGGNVAAPPAGQGDKYSLPTTGEVVLKPVISPAGASCAIGAIALFWNGIISFFIFQTVFSGKALSGGNIFFLVFMVPFVLVGIGILLAALASFGGLFVPRPVLTASSSTVPLGGTVNLRWESKRSFINPKSIKITLEAREEATYTRGTDTVTDKSVFLSRVIFESAPGAPQNGGIAIQIPADGMHSFEAKRNKILWALKVKGDVTYWPNFEDEYRILVTPLPPGAEVQS